MAPAPGPAFWPGSEFYSLPSYSHKQDRTKGLLKSPLTNSSMASWILFQVKDDSIFYDCSNQVTHSWL